MTMAMDEYDHLVDACVNGLKRKKAETLNALHACRFNHPLSCGNRSTDFYNAFAAAKGNLNPELLDKLFDASNTLKG